MTPKSLTLPLGPTIPSFIEQIPIKMLAHLLCHFNLRHILMAHNSFLNHLATLHETLIQLRPFFPCQKLRPIIIHPNYQLVMLLQLRPIIIHPNLLTSFKSNLIQPQPHQEHFRLLELLAASKITRSPRSRLGFHMQIVAFGRTGHQI